MTKERNNYVVKLKTELANFSSNTSSIGHYSLTFFLPANRITFLNISNHTTWLTELMYI